MPPVFISHGSPMTALEPRAAGRFMQQLGPALERLAGRPSAILAISAHTLAAQPMLLAAPQHDTVHDFSGFPPELYELRYDAPGAPALARQAQGLMQAAGIAVHAAPDGGLDHGIWTPLRFMFPAARIPVLPLAWGPNTSPQQLFELGHALAPLAQDGVLVMATGSFTHNLQRVFASGRQNADAPPTLVSAEFCDWFAQRGAERDWTALFDYRRQAPHAVLMHPTDEHLLPWFVAAGAGGRHDAALRLHRSVVHGDLAMDAYAFGPQAADLQAELAR